MTTTTQTAAQEEAEKVLDRILECIADNRSFLLEAGAGSGKTHSLITTLQKLIQERGLRLVASNQRIACITYTNVAKEEIEARTSYHPAVFAGTIHSFCWMLIEPFQKDLRNELIALESWKERIEEAGGISNQRITYNLGYPKITESECQLGHDDVIKITTRLMLRTKFRNIMASRFPIIFIDEYQDTNEILARALLDLLTAEQNAPLLGFFGDHWQKIYRGCGKIANDRLTVIGKKSNFRAAPPIVAVLNAMRPELPQFAHKADDPESEVLVFHTNTWSVDRQGGSHWKEDLPPSSIQSALDKVLLRLTDRQWPIGDVELTKILMLTHNLLAERQGYSELLGRFSFKEALTDKEDDYVKYFAETLEPALENYREKRYGEMFSVLFGKVPAITSPADKLYWNNIMKELERLRSTGTIGEIINALRSSGRIPLPQRIHKREKEAAEWVKNQESEKSNGVERLLNMRPVPYSEIAAVTNFLRGVTPYSTQHGVKGAEFENVVFVAGRGWNLYNFGQMLEWSSVGTPAGKEETFERSRNLFYVASSRPSKRLAILFTQKLSAAALNTLELWFGKTAIVALPEG
jgi:DNA helicase II / ATP-dependent DNA helicase PcrA